MGHQFIFICVDDEICNDQSIGRTSPDPDFEDPDVSNMNKQPISDKHLWSMFGTGVSFRALSTVLDSAFTVANAQNQFCTSTPYLYSNYKRLLQIKENEFQIRIREDQSFGTICFDHQNMRKISGKYEGTSHRLAIVWYCKKTHNVIGIEEMLDKTAESQAQAIHRACGIFNIEKEQIVALTCDNENTNTGVRGGTCVLLEIALNKSLLRLMCRRHIMEIVIKDVYYHLFNSDTPNNIFYNILKEIWGDLREADFPFREFNEDSFTRDMNLETHVAFEELRNKAILELISHSKSKLVRDDYREVTLVALKFLGHYKNTRKANEVKFRTIINPSMARFMAVAIQGLECYLFRRSIDWTLSEREGMKHNIMRFATFVALIYVRYWNRSSNLFDAPFNDLCFLKELQVYQMFDAPVAKVAISAISRHLNYMSEELTPLCLFSEKVSVDEKNRISENLRASFDDILPLRNGNQGSNHILFHHDDEDNDWEQLSLSDLIGIRSHFFFQSMNLPLGFLNIDANEWKINKDYKNAKKIVENSLICINDASERVISKCKSKFSKQRCRKEITFRQNILSFHLND